MPCLPGTGGGQVSCALLGWLCSPDFAHTVDALPVYPARARRAMQIGSRGQRHIFASRRGGAAP